MRRIANCGAAHFLCCPPRLVLVALSVGCRPGEGVAVRYAPCCPCMCARVPAGAWPSLTMAVANDRCRWPVCGRPASGSTHGAGRSALQGEGAAPVLARSSRRSAAACGRAPDRLAGPLPVLRRGGSDSRSFHHRGMRRRKASPWPRLLALLALLVAPCPLRPWCRIRRPWAFPPCPPRTLPLQVSRMRGGSGGVRASARA